eukprot:evm.model.NODE_4407_length_63659_cov_22.504595.4
MLASSITSTSGIRTGGGGSMIIYLVGAANQRMAVADAMGKAVGWPVVKAASVAALLSSPSNPAIVDVDDTAMADAKGAEFLGAQPLVIRLVEKEDFAGNDEKHKSRQAVSRFDVAVGSEPDVPLSEIVQSIQHITRLSVDRGGDHESEEGPGHGFPGLVLFVGKPYFKVAVACHA